MELKKSFFGSLDDWIDFTGEPEIIQDQESLDIQNFLAREMDGSSWETDLQKAA